MLKFLAEKCSGYKNFPNKKISQIFQPTIAQWRIVFLIASTIYTICATFYIMFGQGERQDWDNPAKDAIKNYPTSENDSQETNQMLKHDKKPTQ